MCALNNEWARVQKAAYSRPATLRESYVEVPAWILTAGPHLPPFSPTPLPYPMSTSKSSEIGLPKKFLPPNNFEHEMVVCQLHDQKALQSVSGNTN